MDTLIRFLLFLEKKAGGLKMIENLRIKLLAKAFWSWSLVARRTAFFLVGPHD